ncbi:MAG: ATP synthase F1 subunit delta, partial [Methylocella sp.]
RLFALSDIVVAFETRLAKHRGELSASVTSAKPLKPEQVTALAGTLKDAFKREVRVTQFVDPALLGGLVVKVGSRMVDGSLRTKLNNLKIAMKEVG